MGRRMSAVTLLCLVFAGALLVNVGSATAARRCGTAAAGAAKNVAAAHTTCSVAREVARAITLGISEVQCAEGGRDPGRWGGFTCRAKRASATRARYRCVGNRSAKVYFSVSVSGGGSE
jgi:hypothetical protein